MIEDLNIAKALIEAFDNEGFKAMQFSVKNSD